MFNDPKIIIAVVIFIISLGIWAGIVIVGKADIAPFLTFVQLVVGGAWTAIFAFIDPKQSGVIKPPTINQ